MSRRPCPYVHQIPRSANLYYIRDVPQDVRASVGKSKWKISLGTATRSQAMRKAWPLAVQHDEEIRVARAPDLMSTLPPEDQQRIADSGGLKAHLKWLDERAQEAERLASVASDLRDWSGETGPPDEIPDSDWADGQIAAMQAERGAIARQMAREASALQRLGLTSERVAPEHPALSAALHSSALAPELVTLHRVLDQWVEKKAPSAPDQYAFPIRLFEDLFGPLPLAEITKAHIREFRDALGKRPRAGGAKLANIPLPVQLTLADEQKLARVSSATAEKDFRCFKTILAFAVDEGYLDHNPALGIKFHSERQKHAARLNERRRSIAPEELRRLLDAATEHWKPADAWFVRLLAYTGARPEEIAQLAAKDITTIRDQLCIRIHDEGSNNIKNSASYRIIPVHPKLVEYRIEEFVRDRNGADMLFGHMVPNRRNRRYGNMQRRLMALIRNKAKIKDTRVVPYSMRHAFKDSMRVIGAPEEVVERIMGHRSPDRAVARGYGNPDQVHVLARWMGKVDPLDCKRQVTDQL